MKVFIIVLALMLGACTNATPEPTITPEPTLTKQPVVFSFDNVEIELQQLPGWDVYVKTQDRLIMAEGDDPFRTSGGLKGLLINMWVPSLSNLSVEYDLDQHSIADVLSLVLRTSNIENELAVNDPISFDWGGHDAAYYTLTNANGNLSLVLAMKVADEHFIAVNISAPDGHGSRIREALPKIFNPFYINDTEVSNTDLLSLPEPLVFPELNAVSSTSG